MEAQMNMFPSSSGMKFEDDFFSRTYSQITNRPDLALTELVANAWDSGADTVKISIPSLETVEECIISIEDNGSGMTADEFSNRWMRLGYNRLRHQGDYAEIPDGSSIQKRRAYGRNGIGRHSLFCFGNSYNIETWKNGVVNKYKLSQSGGDTPLKILEHSQEPREGHGTLLFASITKNHPYAKEITAILSARFMYDPEFKLYVNERIIGLEDFEGEKIVEKVTIGDDLTIELTALSSNKTARKSHQHGVAFWVNGRLVGEPSWIIGKRNLADKRTTIARQYTIIVQSKDMLEDVNADWTALKENTRVESVYNAVEAFSNKLLKEVNHERNNALKFEIINKYSDDFKFMDHSSRREVIELVDQVVDEVPDISKGYLEITISKLVGINKSKNKRALIERIFSLTDQDAGKLNAILDDWDVSDIEFILDEIDRRIAAIEAIERLSSVEGMDELHVLHLLILEAKWLFGPEFDSSFYISNSRLSTILRKHLKKPERVSNLSTPKKRPDIIVFDDGSLIGYATEEPDMETGLAEYKHLLLIELKCGGKEISSVEVAQTEEYMNELFYSNAFNSKIRIDAFTVGSEVSNRMGRSRDIKGNDSEVWGRLVATSYTQLVGTAEKRLFGLKQQLSERYDSMNTPSLLEKALNEQQAQISLEYVKKTI